MEEAGPAFGGGGGSNCIFLLYIPIELVILQGMGSGPPAPSSGVALGIINWVRPHIVLVTMVTPLMQVLLALVYYATGSYCLVIGDALGI